MSVCIKEDWAVVCKKMMFAVVVVVVVCVLGVALGQEEAQCVYVSSRGIMWSCDVRPWTNVEWTPEYLYPYDWTVVKNNNSVVYVPGSVVDKFVSYALPRIRAQFVLVSGDCDLAMPTSVLQAGRLLADGRLIHWFTQNLVERHSKMSALPIGMDYHTFSTQIRPTEQERVLVGYRERAPGPA